MLTFPNIFDNILGLFPNVFAKNASGAGSTDGTEYKKTVVDELLFGWIQRLLVKVSQTPNGVPETSSTSQIFDAMREAFNTPEFQQISASGAVVFGKTNHQIELDVSLGNVDISALALSDFIGQHVHFYAVGSGIGSIAGGNGVYVNDIFITENTGGAHLWGVSGGLWKADNGVTADYVSVSESVWLSSDGTYANTDRRSYVSDGTAKISMTYSKVFAGIRSKSVSFISDSNASSWEFAFTLTGFNSGSIAELYVRKNGSAYAGGSIQVAEIKTEGEY